MDEVVRLAAQDVPDLPGTTFDPELVRTVPSAPEDSIGRWRERHGAFQEVLSEVLAEPLAAFGYELPGAAGAEGTLAAGTPGSRHQEEWS